MIVNFIVLKKSSTKVNRTSTDSKSNIGMPIRSASVTWMLNSVSNACEQKFNH